MSRSWSLVISICRFLHFGGLFLNLLQNFWQIVGVRHIRDPASRLRLIRRAHTIELVILIFYRNFAILLPIFLDFSPANALSCIVPGFRLPVWIRW